MPPSGVSAAVPFVRSTRIWLESVIALPSWPITMPAGANGKLYGAVTNAAVADELLKKGLEIDRKKIEIPGRSIKSVGSYKIDIHLYEKEEAVLKLLVLGQEVKAEKADEGEQPKKQRQRKPRTESAEPVTDEEQAAAFEAAVNAGRLN